MKKFTLFLVAITMSLFSFAQTQMSGEYTVGTGGTYDYASLADAGMAIKSAEFTDDVTLLICTDLTETINTGIVNKSNYTLTIRPDKDENRTITYTTAKDNTGPTGVFVIGGDMTKTPGTTIGWASVPTRNVIVDGAAAGYTTPRLKITNEVFGTNVLLYGDVQDVIIRNCILVGRSSNTAYALVFRSEKYSKTSKDIAPKNCLVENCILQSSSASSQTVYFQGNEANSVAGWPASITIRNSTIKARTRGMYVRQVKNLNIEGCTFDMSNSTSGILAHAIMGEGARGTINVKGNKFIKNSTANTYGGAYGLQTITASGGADVWVIENNYFAGYDALKAISNTTNGTEARLVAVRCGDYCEVRHNTFHMPNLTKDQASKLVSASPTTLLWLAGSHQYPVQNNIFVCEETTANVSLIRGGLNENVTGNVFYHKGGNAAIVAAAPSCMTFANLETSYPTQAATSKWTNVTFADAANGDLSLAGASDGDANLAVDRLAEVLTDINGTARREKTYAGAYEGSEFPAEVCSVTTMVVPVDGGTVEGGGDYAKGASVTLTATSNDHYDFVSWTEDGEVVSTTEEYSFTVTKNIELTANFQEHDKFTITANAADNTMGYVTGGGTYYAGETVTLKAVAKNTYYFINWSDGNTDATRTFIAAADVELTANFAKAFPRTWAYDLTLSEDGDNYKFTFTTTSEGTATIHFNDREGNKLYESYSAGVIEAGTHNVLIDKTYFPQNKDVYWSVQMDGAEIPVIAEVTDQSRGIYDFYNMMGVVVDNDPESPYFSDIYIQQSLQYTSGSTAERNKTQTSGIYIYDQGLNEMNSPANTGIQPQLPYALGGNRQNFKRLTINPTNRHLAFCNNVAGSGAVYSVGMDNLTAPTNNLISHIDEIDNANALCFDKDGNLYVVANVVTNYTVGDIYKIASDGTYTKITPLRPDGKKIWVDEEIAIASDGRGGVWVAQKRDGITQYSALFHVNFEQSKVDFVLEEGQDYSDWFTGTNRRGAIAYDEQRDILAVHGPSAASLFSVAYDGEGVPTITKFAQTHNIGSSNIDGLAFDYAGDLYLVSSGTEKFYKFAVPTNNNTCTTPASQNQIIKKEIWYDVIVNINDNTMGTVNGAGSYLENSQATLTATPTANHRFVNWKEGETILSTSTNYAFTVTKETTLTATFEPIPQYTINVTYDNTMGTVTGDGTYYEGTEVTLTAKANGGYVFVKWGDEVTDESRTFTAGVDLPETLTATFKAAVPRAWAYDLRQVENSENYEFTFKTTSAGTATLIFKDKDGNTLDFGEHTATATTAEEKTITIVKSVFDAATKDIYWEVELAGDAIAKMAEITDPTEGIYNFYVPQGVAVDNSPNSMYFGRIYVAEGTTGANDGGSEMAKQMTAGLFVYNQALEKVQPATGYTGIIPQNVTFNTNKPTSADEINIIRQQMHRVAVDPVTGEVAFAYYKSPATAIYSMNPDDLAGNAQNLIEGSSITYANSLCFDSEGALYVMDNANTGLTGGQIYKVQNGEVTLFAAHDKNNQWAVYDNAMASDGRGGIWIAQNRYGYDYPILSHVNKDGVVDFAVKENLNSWFPNNNTGSSYRGQLAYNLNENILAFAGNKMVTLFTVEYDGNGKPTINKLMSTPLLGGGYIDGVAFDYAGDLYVASASAERLYKFVVPTNTNTCIVPAPATQKIEKEQKYIVTVKANPAAGGIVSVSDGGNAVEGATLEVTATANAGYRFVNWTKGSDEVSTDASFSYTVPAGDVTLIANFELITYTLITSTNDENKGTVIVDGVCTHGSTVTLTATPKVGYKLLYWSDRSTENPRTITMTKNEAVSAYFVKDYAEEPTFKIEKMWEKTNVPASTNNGYQGAGWDGKIYVKDRLNNKILVYSKTESSSYVEFGGSYEGFAGDQAITMDDAGNMIIRSGSAFFYDAPGQIRIFKNGETTYKTIDFTLPETKRCDFISASGDIYSAEGGYVYFYCQNQTTVSRLYIKNGGASAADVSVDKLDNATLTAGSSQSHVFTNIFGDLMTHTRDNNYKVLQEVNVLTGAVSTMNLPNFKKSTLGGCSFELGGKEFIAYNIAGKDYNSEWNLYNMTDKVFMSNEALYAKNTTDKNSAANWLNVQVVDENTAYIYQFCPTVGVAVWKVSVETPKYTREVTNGDYGTICLPYGSSDFTGAEFYEITYLELEADGTTPKGIWLDEVTELEAGKPYIFKATADKLVVYYEGEEALSPVEGKAGLTGTFSLIEDLNTSDPSNTLEGNYMIAYNKFWLCGTGCWLNANRAYIKYEVLHASTTPVSPMPGRRRVYMGGAGENSATGTEDMIVPNQQVQKVIENGQLIIIRDGVKYNVQGVRL